MLNLRGKKSKIVSTVLALALLVVGCSKGSSSSSSPANTSNNQNTSSTPTSDLKFFKDQKTPIQMTIPYGAGGGTDLIARKLQKPVQEALGKTIVASNMPGAAGAIGADYFKKQANDGFSLMFFPETLGLYPAMAQSDLKVDDFIQVYGVNFAPGTFVVKPDSPYKTLDDVAKAAKANSGKIKLSVSGIGDAWYVCCALFQKYADVKIEIVPYNSGKEAALAALKGEVDVGACGLIEAVDFLANKQLVSLGVFAPEDYDIKGYGKVPSVLNTYPDMAEWLPAGSWHGAFLPKDTPKEIVDAYISAYDKATGTEEFKQYCIDNGLILMRKSYPEVQDYAREYAKKFSWFLYDSGVAVREPSTVGIERPAK